MSWKSALPKTRWHEIIELYQSGMPARTVAERLGISIDAVFYVMRKLQAPRRSFKDANRLAFEAKVPSFTVHTAKTLRGKDLELTGALLYWAEGYKTSKAAGIDFANSDPDMVLLFLQFLRSRYRLEASRLYCQLYYYADQDLRSITDFWSKKLDLPLLSFRYPYMKKDPRPNARKLPYGVLHIRYNDKKLLRDVLSLIHSYKRKLLR